MKGDNGEGCLRGEINRVGQRTGVRGQETKLTPRMC